MTHQLTWQTTPGLRGLVCSKFRAVKTLAPDTERGVAVSLKSDEERESLLAELEMHFAAQRFASDAAAFEAVKAYALGRVGGKQQI
jgi:hypothetical protein